MVFKIIKKNTPLLLCPAALVISAVALGDSMVTEGDLLVDIQRVNSVTHMDQTLPETPASVTIIDRRMIDASPAVDVVDLLRMVPGLQTYFVNANRPGVTYHTLGNSYPRRLEVKVDGRSVYESLFSSVEWTTLGVDLADIDHIEVVRGANAPADGSNAFLASINIITRSPLIDSGWNLRGEGGSNSIRNGSLSYAGAAEELNYRARLSYRSNEGFDNFDNLILDDGAETITLSFKGLWTPSASDSLELKFGVSDSDIGVGKRDSIPRKLDYQYQHLQWDHLTEKGNKYQFIAYHNLLEITDYDEPLGFHKALAELPDSPSKTALLQLPDKLIIDGESNGESERWDTEFRTLFNQWDDFRAVTGIGLRFDRVKSEDFFDSQDGISKTSFRAYANFQWTASDRNVLNGGVIREHDDSETFSSFRVASNFQLADNQTLRLAFNRGYRAPTLLESNQTTYIRYNEDMILDGSIVSDPDINPEQLTSTEIGYMGSFLNASLSIDLRIFNEKLRDVIGERREQYADLDGQINIRDNTESIDVQGAEWQAQYRPNNNFLVNASYSYVKFNGERLWRSTPYVEYRSLEDNSPGHSAGLLVNYTTDDRLSLSTMINYQSGMRHPQGSVLDNYTRVDLKAAKKFDLNNTDMEVSFTVQNAGSDYFEFYEINAFKTRYIFGFEIGFP
jgi:iron complex outermembrane receptor protein